MASFLPLVRELSEQYDPLAIAAAAIQMVYDQNCPHWMKTDWEVPSATSSKPVIKPRKNSGNGGGKYSQKLDKSNRYLDRKTVIQN